MRVDRGRPACVMQVCSLTGGQGMQGGIGMLDRGRGGSLLRARAATLSAGQWT